MIQREHELQVVCINWFRLAFPQYGKALFAIPNGGARNIIVASKLKAEGVLKGVPDLFLSVPSNGYHGLYIEMKVKPNKPSPEQIELMEMYECLGYKCVVCYSSYEFMECVKAYLAKTK